MGPLFSKSTEYSAQISGNNNNIWIIDTTKFNITLMLDQTIQSATKRFQNILIANNPGVIINVMLILTIVILLILFLYLKRHYQQPSPKIILSKDTIINSVKCSTSSIPSSKHIPNRIEVYLI
jgi:hypothetical protein